MYVAKLRVRHETGLVPAGRYFEHLARSLRARAGEHPAPEVLRRPPTTRSPERRSPA